MEQKKQPLTKEQKKELLLARLAKIKSQIKKVDQIGKPTRAQRARALIQIGAYYCYGKNPFEVLEKLKPEIEKRKLETAQKK